MGFVLKLRRKEIKKRPYYDIIVTNQTQGFTGKNICKVGFVRDLDTKVIIYLDSERYMRSFGSKLLDNYG